jgi:hypothetical protein
MKRIIKRTGIAKRIVTAFASIQPNLSLLRASHPLAAGACKHCVGTTHALKGIMSDGDQERGALQTNFERLLSHLQTDSLAARLVSAYAGPGEYTPVEAVSNAIAERLAELKRRHDEPENQQD